MAQPPSGIVNAAQQDEQHYQQERRAPQACLRCRKQKLRCLGGRPCVRCVKADRECDFGAGTAGNAAHLCAPNVAVGVVQQQGQQYHPERRAPQACLRCRKQKLRCLGGKPCARCVEANKECYFANPGHALTASNSTTTSTVTNGNGNGEGHVSSASTSTTAPALSSTSEPTSATHLPVQVRFGNPPEASYVSPLSYSTQRETTSPSASFDAAPTGKHRDAEQEAEARLASATRDGFEPPPFQALVYQPSVWENREASKRNSPQPDEQSSDPARMSSRGVRDDLVISGVIDLATAKLLYTFFVDYCHPFLPIVDVANPDPFAAVQRYPSLFSAILAISARFYLRHSNTSHAIDSHAPAALADIAESHLAHTLLRKQHTLADVQAILLLAAWGLKSGGKGPDAWVLTGHAARVSRRLGIHRAVGRAVAATKRDDPLLEAPASELDAAVRRQWRTWLAWFSFDSFLSFGFGRPQSTQFESIDDQAFLKARLSQPLPRPGTPASLSLYGDAYIAATAQLAHVARSFVLWVEEQAPVGPPDSQSLLSMLSDLNERLDEWCKIWVWSGTSHALYLGASARIARLQAEHLRLSINSMALRTSTHTESSVAYLRKALNAATSTIQTHFESSQTDLALSFATDYMTMAFAQAAVFLIRLTKAPHDVQQAVALDPAVLSHYLTMSVDLLELGDLSETRLSTYFARTIRGIARAAGLVIRPDDSTTTTGGDEPRQGVQHHEPEHSLPFFSADGTAGDAGLYDGDTFLAAPDLFDLSCVLGLSGGGVAPDMDWLDQALAVPGSFSQPAAPSWDVMFGTGEGSA